MLPDARMDLRLQAQGKVDNIFFEAPKRSWFLVLPYNSKQWFFDGRWWCEVFFQDRRNRNGRRSGERFERSNSVMEFADRERNMSGASGKSENGISLDLGWA